MTRNIRALNQGRYRVWFLTHRIRAFRALQVCTVVCLFLVASAMDYRDQLAAEKAAHADVKRILAEQAADKAAAKALPQTVYVLEAATPEKAREKLARIAGQLDYERGILGGYK